MAEKKDPYAGFPPHFKAAWESGGCVLVHGPAGSVHATGPDDLPEGWQKPAVVEPLRTQVVATPPSAGAEKPGK